MCRIWLDLPGKSGTLVDVAALVASYVSTLGGIEVKDIPKGSLKKCYPLEKRIKIKTEREIAALAVGLSRTIPK